MGNVHLEHPRGLQMPLLYPQDILSSRVRGKVNWRIAAITGGAVQISGESRLTRCLFGRFELRSDERVLLVDGQPAALGARAFDLLQMLIEQRDRLLTKEELLRTVWAGLVVSENNLHAQVSALRAVLGAPAIATVAGRGYRFALQIDGERGAANPADLGPVAAVGPSGSLGALEGLQRPLCFGRVEVRPRERQLLVDGQAVSVGSRAFDLLLQLIRLHPRLVTKNELLDLVWPGVIVAENNLQAQMSALRKLLGSQAIATVPGHGYTFTLLQSQGGAEASHPEAQRRDQEVSTCLRPGNLAVRMPPLYGRGDDLAALTRLLQSQRVLSVVGPGGIGKDSQVLDVPDGGCAASQLDADHDGVPDSIDQCPNTTAGAAVNAAGCSAAQRDSDGDGVPDSIDRCAGTPAGTPVDASGCSLPAQSKTCDVNGDKFIDYRDIGAILVAINKPSTGATDPRDANRNGKIDLIDAAICTSRCDRVLCLPPR